PRLVEKLLPPPHWITLLVTNRNTLTWVPRPPLTTSRNRFTLRRDFEPWSPWRNLINGLISVSSSTSTGYCLPRSVLVAGLGRTLSRASPDFRASSSISLRRPPIVSSSEATVDA